MKKFIMNLAVFDEKDKRKAMKIVSALPGIDEISIDMKGQKLTIIGTVDPVSVVSKLRKFWQTDIILVGPKEEPKKEEPKKEEGKKEEPKKEDPPKEEPEKEDAKKEEDPKKEEPKKEDQEKKEALVPIPVMAPLHGLHPGQGMYPGHGLHPGHGPLPMPVIGTVMPYRQYNPPMQTYYYGHNHSIEENPNACVIC